MAKISELIPYTNSLSLLYVEEDQKLLHDVSAVLKNIFFRIDDANNANDAIGFVKFNKYDIFILDSVSTIMSIHQLIKALKSIQPSIRIIVTVKNFSDEQLIGLYELGVESIIHKPFSASGLLDHILKIATSLSIERSYLQNNIDKLKQELSIERKKIGHLLLSEKKHKLQIETFKNTVDINRNIHELTTLPTRYVLQKILGKMKQSLLYINIDNFDFVNSVYGMGNANKLLKETASRLNTFLPKNAELFHITADEFAILLNEPSENQAFDLSKQIQAFFKEAPIKFDRNIQYVVFSIGIDTRESQVIFINAKSASREARNFGGDQCVVYSSSSPYAQEQRENLYWIKVLKEAFYEDRILTYYQPIINTKNPEIKHYEVLCRLEDENGRLVDANKFIKTAKLVGLITQITKIVIDRAFKEFQNNDYDFSINISYYDLHERYLLDFLEYKCDKYGISRERIYLEIIEETILSQFDSISNQIVKLKEMGYNVIVDSFGSNKSTFNRILDMHVNFIKIDGSLIKEINSNQSYRTIVQSIVDFAKKSGIKIIAEHVESKAVLETLNELGVDYIQGFLLGKPSLDLK